jgi:hypothetical protein
MAAIIIISFLSLMSFADFLRVHWQQAQRDQEGEGGHRRRQNDVAGANEDDNNNRNNETDADVVLDHAIDNGVILFMEKNKSLRGVEPKLALDDNDGGKSKDGHESSNLEEEANRNSVAQQYAQQAKQLRELGKERDASRGNSNLEDENNNRDDEDGPVAEPRQEPVEVEDVPGDDDYDEDSEDSMMDEIEDGWANEEIDEEDDEDDAVVLGLPRPPRQDVEQVVNPARDFDAMDPILQDDQVVSFCFDDHYLYRNFICISNH